MSEKKFWKVSPHIPVKDVEETVDWYKKNLGFAEEWYYGNPVTDGGCKRDELRLLFGKVEGVFEKPKELSLIFFVSAVDEVYEEVVAKGIEITLPIATYDYGIREFSIIDLNGYPIRFAEAVEI